MLLESANFKNNDEAQMVTLTQLVLPQPLCPPIYIINIRQSTLSAGV